MNERCATCGTLEINNYCTDDDCDETYSGWTSLKAISTRATAINLVDAERTRQDKKWGTQDHAQQAWVGILGEEFGEYCQCVNETYLSNATKKHEGGYDNLLKELTHVAAVAVGAMESLMRNREEEK